MNEILIAMRLADMAQVHPGQDNSRACAGCGAQVGLYPTGQAALKARPTMEIRCHVCALAPGHQALGSPAGPVEDILQEARDSRPARTH